MQGPARLKGGENFLRLKQEMTAVFMVVTYKQSSSLPSGGTHHLHVQKSEAGRIKLQEHVDRFC
jgi:hypothetical protein